MLFDYRGDGVNRVAEDEMSKFDADLKIQRILNERMILGNIYALLSDLFLEYPNCFTVSYEDPNEKSSFSLKTNAITTFRKKLDPLEIECDISICADGTSDISVYLSSSISEDKHGPFRENFLWYGLRVEYFPENHPTTLLNSSEHSAVDDAEKQMIARYFHESQFELLQAGGFYRFNQLPDATIYLEQAVDVLYFTQTCIYPEIDDTGSTLDDLLTGDTFAPGELNNLRLLLYGDCRKFQF